MVDRRVVAMIAYHDEKVSLPKHGEDLTHRRIRLLEDPGITSRILLVPSQVRLLDVHPDQAIRLGRQRLDPVLDYLGGRHAGPHGRPLAFDDLRNLANQSYRHPLPAANRG